jgi:hypothetical protein
MGAVLPIDTISVSGRSVGKHRHKGPVNTLVSQHSINCRSIAVQDLKI